MYAFSVAKILILVLIMYLAFHIYNNNYDYNNAIIHDIIKILLLCLSELNLPLKLTILLLSYLTVDEKETTRDRGNSRV